MRIKFLPVKGDLGVSQCMAEPFHAGLQCVVFFKAHPVQVPIMSEPGKGQTERLEWARCHNVQYIVRVGVVTDKSQCQMQVFLACEVPADTLGLKQALQVGQGMQYFLVIR